MATSQAPKKRVYCHRLQNLVTEGGAYVIRTVLDKLTGVPLSVHLQNNHAIFSQPKSKSKGLSVKRTVKLTQKQYDKLFISPGKPSSVTSADLDITLLVCLLQNTCDSCGLKPGTDPVWYSNPTAKDVLVEHDIVRIRNFRNEISHRTSNMMSQHDFQSTWSSIETVLLRLYKPYSTNTQSLLEKIDELKNGSVDEEAEERNERIIEEWEEMDRCIQASLETIQTSINTLTENVQEMKDSPRLASLKDISERYFRRMDETKNMFVRTATYNKAEEKLNKSGITILSGYAGEGKTTMASQLLLNTCPLQKILKLSTPKDMKEVSTKYWNGIFIDDIFGSTTLDHDRAKSWDSYLRDLVQDADNRTLSVVMTTRRNILCDVKEHFNLDIFKKDNVIEVSSSDLSKEEKKKILSIHLEKNNRTLSDVNMNYCISSWKNEECKVGFPECAVMFASSDALFEKRSNFFARPFEFFQKFISELSKNEDEFMILVLIWTKSTKTLSKFDLDSKIFPLEDVAKTLGYNLEKKSKTLRKVLQHHKDGLLSLTHRNDEYTFSHSVIEDVVGLVLGEDYPDLVIKYGSKSFIMNYITVNDETTVNGIYVDERRYPILSQRLIELIFDKKEVTSEQDDKFWGFINTPYLKGTENMLIVQTLPDISILDHNAFNNVKFIKEYVGVAYGNGTISTPVLEVFEHFRNAYCIVFNGREMGVSVSVVLLARKNKRMIIECINRDILTVNEKYIALLFATRNNDLTLVRKLTGTGALINEDTLQIAAVNENIKILKHLLSHFPQQNTTVSHIQNGNSPLITASKRGSFEVVQCLLQSDIDINYRNEHGQSALDKAVICDEVAICEALVQKGCKVNAKAGKFSRTPLHTAVDMGSIEIVKLLLRHEASVFTTDHRENYPIHSAAVLGDIGIVKLLLKYGRCLAERPFKYYGRITTLYHYAVQKENIQLLQCLIEAEVEPNIQDRFGRTPLYMAVYYNKPEFVKLLIEKSDVNLVENKGYTPLHAAVFKLNPEMVEMLCRYNVDIRMVDRKGNSLFHVLKNVSNQQRGRGDNTCVRVSKCVKMLLEKDEEIETYLQRIPNRKGETVSILFDGELYFLL